MTIYWLLFAFPAVMALVYPADSWRMGHNAKHVFAFTCFMIVYTILAMIRYEVGGDWNTYEFMYEDVLPESIFYAMTKTEIVFGAILWISGQLGAGIYFANGICAALLAWGVMRTAMMTREPWLALTIAVPYILIVIGLGYVRQAGAIGLVLMAISTIERPTPWRTVLYLALAIGFHSTSSLFLPLFGYAMARRHKAIALAAAVLGGFALFFIIAPRLAEYEAGYIEQEYDSQGTAVRLLMSVLPSIVLLVRRGHFVSTPRARVVWIGIGLANLAALAAFVISPSSTAVDRMALYFSPIQVLVFGEIMRLGGFANRMTLVVRVFGIGIAAAVQAVFLIFAAHAEYWVPYQTVLSQL